MLMQMLMSRSREQVFAIRFFFYSGFLSAGGANPRFQGLRLSAVHGGAGAELQGRRSHRHERHLQRVGVTTELLFGSMSQRKVVLIQNKIFFEEFGSFVSTVNISWNPGAWKLLCRRSWKVCE